LNGNNITKLPNWIWNFTKLKKLYLNWNDIKILPSTIVKLKNLVELDLGNNLDFWPFSDSKELNVMDKNWNLIKNKKIKIFWNWKNVEMKIVSN